MGAAPHHPVSGHFRGRPDAQQVPFLMQLPFLMQGAPQPRAAPISVALGGGRHTPGQVAEPGKRTTVLPGGVGPAMQVGHPIGAKGFLILGAIDGGVDFRGKALLVEDGETGKYFLLVLRRPTQQMLVVGFNEAIGVTGVEKIVCDRDRSERWHAPGRAPKDPHGGKGIPPR